MTGWDKVTCGQLQALLKSCQPQQALKLLLRNSRSHPARSQQHKKPRLQQNQDGDGDNGSSDSSDSGTDSESEVDEAWEREHSWFSLPQDIAVQGARVVVVPDTDPREALRGQQGLWATEDLPEGYLLGEGGWSLVGKGQSLVLLMLGRCKAEVVGIEPMCCA